MSAKPGQPRQIIITAIGPAPHALTRRLVRWRVVTLYEGHPGGEAYEDPLYKGAGPPPNPIKGQPKVGGDMGPLYERPLPLPYSVFDQKTLLIRFRFLSAQFPFDTLRTERRRKKIGQPGFIGTESRYKSRLE